MKSTKTFLFAAVAILFIRTNSAHAYYPVIDESSRPQFKPGKLITRLFNR